MVNDLKLKLSSLETTLHKADDDALYHLYMAEYERLKISTANVTDATSLDALRERLTR